MTGNQLEYTTVVASRGRRIHAVALSAPTRTACGRLFTGWMVSIKRLNCGLCKRAILGQKMTKGTTR